MAKYIYRLLLTASSIAPVCFTVSFIGFTKNNSCLLYIPLASGIFVCLFCIIIVHLIKQRVQISKIKIVSVMPANKEIANYFISYIFPLLGADSIFENLSMTIFFFVCLVLYILFSVTYNFNPLLSLLGYKFYEAQQKNGFKFILLSKTNLDSIDDKESINVKQLSNYIYIYYDGDGNEK